MNTRQQFSVSFLELRYSFIEFNSRRICQILINWTRWNNAMRFQKQCELTFKRRFLSLRLPCCYVKSYHLWNIFVTYIPVSSSLPNAIVFWFQITTNWLLGGAKVKETGGPVEKAGAILFKFISLVRHIWRSTFVLEMIFRRSDG